MQGANDVVFAIDLSDGLRRINNVVSSALSAINLALTDQAGPRSNGDEPLVGVDLDALWGGLLAAPLIMLAL